MKIKINHLKELSGGLGLMYVEDNDGLRKNMEKVLSSFCDDVWCVENGDHAWSVYSRQHPAIVITDLHMPGMNGFELMRRIKGHNPSARIIVLSAHSEKEDMIRAIECGVCAYLTKPAKLDQVLDTLERTAESIKEEENRQILQTLLHDVFHYQNNLLLMFDSCKPILANQRFLDFFGVDSLKAFLSTMDLDRLLQEHNNFLFTTAEKPWLDEAFENLGKLFHTKIQDAAGEYRHLIMKARDIPEKESYTIVSFDDVTELQLMAMFDSKTHGADKRKQERSAILKLFKIVQENAAQVEIHSFYKGLSITNPAVVTKIDGDRVILKSAFTQLKSVQLAKNMLITSEIFPQPVWVKRVEDVNYDDQSIVFNQVEFASSSACQRANIRLEPEPKHTATLFFKGKKVPGDVRIIDISVCSVKIEIEALPAGIGLNDTVELNMVLSSPQPTIFHTNGTIFRIEELKRSYQLIILFELQGIDHKHMSDYIAHRQMALIREFKSLS